MVKKNLKKKVTKTKKSVTKSKKVVKSKKFLWKGFLPIAIAIVAIFLILMFTLMPSGVSEGDKVAVNYIGTLEDGTLFDTNVESAALEAGMQREQFLPFTFTVGAGEVVSGFDAALIGMGVGETKTVDLTSDEAYGSSDSSLLFELPMVQEMNRYDTLTLSDFEGVFDDAFVGKVITLEGLSWEIEVIEITETAITIENLLVLGDEVGLPYVDWKGEVVKIKEETIDVLQKPELGQTFMLPMEGTVQQGSVSEIGEEMFLVDFNHMLAGKALTFEIELLEIL
jgi:FKBP-type peptidyl-prolyl cis-trans isomerase 2